MATEEGMVVDILVKVRVSNREPQYRDAEERLENETLSVVAECLSKEKAVELLEASLLEFEHCQWVFEDGMPVDCGLAKPVRMETDGSWSYPYDGDPLHPEHSGRDFSSLMQFVQQQRAK